ncbi:hypothetical protein [Methanosarcina mazei]|uniref:PEF-CTERM protein sorting domain-containing protein n=1 Tax=Methanosarcina mazei TaxID=2209 RepID=A0A0F8D382_METMZ|nr:hypothetical protein [Methanosarcina mazei]KKG11814.1 hypothetical protein DU34_04255 [Methanosarcina mazei]
MKKILLLLVSGLLIACMAGSAMADPCNVDLGKYSFNIGSPSGDSTTVKVNYYTIAGDRTISVITSDPSIEAQLVGSTGSSDWASGDDMKSLVYSISGTKVNGIITSDGVNPLEDTFTLKIRHKDGTALKSGYVYVYANEGTTYLPAAPGASGVVRANDAGSASGTASVPEFPTIAAGMGAIIGLLFIFGRKKEGL